MMSESKCVFCGFHPYEYVDVGVGMVPVAVNCCPEGELHYDHRYGWSVRRIKFEWWKRAWQYRISKLLKLLRLK